jgi:hypothetical protein
MSFFLFRYIYGGKISLEDNDTLDIIKILIAANVQELINHLQSFFGVHHLLVRIKYNSIMRAKNVHCIFIHIIFIIMITKFDF